MKCAVCGAENEPGTAYCYQCGSRLQQGLPPATGQTVMMNSNTVAESQPAPAQPTARTYEAPPLDEAGSRNAPYAAPPAVEQRAFDASNHPLMQPETPRYQEPRPTYQQSAPPYQQPQQYQQMPSAQSPYLVTSVTLNGTQTSTLAVFSLVLGILSWMVIPLIGSIGGVITGHMARREIANSGGTKTGMGMALAGLILSYINIFMAIGACALFAVLVGTS